MGRTLSGIVMNAGISAKLTNALNHNLGSSSLQITDQDSVSLLPGSTGAGNADSIWSDPARTLAESATETLDINAFAGLSLGAGTAVDALGVAIANLEIVGLKIENSAASVGTLTVGDAGSDAFAAILGATGTVTLPPGSFCMFGCYGSAGWALTSSLNNLLITNGSAGAATYSITILGRSAA